MSSEIHPAYASQRYKGMPPLNEDGPTMSWFEMASPIWFYLPVAAYMIYLSWRYGGWPSWPAANYGLPMGGVVGDSKIGVLSQFGSIANQHTAQWVSIEGDKSADAATRTNALNTALQTANIAYPVVLKPDIGCRGAGIKVARHQQDIQDYCQGFPAEQALIAQALVPHEAEAGVYYVRHPHEQTGRVVSLTLKYAPFVTGDGQSTVRQLIEADTRAANLKEHYFRRHANNLENVLPKGQALRLAFSGSLAQGAIFRNGNAFINDAMNAAFDEIAKDIPGFHCGRFDIRFASIEALQRGEDFKIIELNGGSGERTHIWDNRTTLREAWRTQFEQMRTLWCIGHANRQAGNSSASRMQLLRAWWFEKTLVRRYPETD